MSRVAVAPAETGTQCLDGLDAPLQRLRAGGPIGGVPHPRRPGRRQLEGVEFVVVEGAQVDAVTFASALGQSKDPGEEVQTGLGLVGQELDMAKVSDVPTGLSLHSLRTPWVYASTGAHLRPARRMRQMVFIPLLMNSMHELRRLHCASISWACRRFSVLPSAAASKERPCISTCPRPPSAIACASWRTISASNCSRARPAP